MWKVKEGSVAACSCIGKASQSLRCIHKVIRERKCSFIYSVDSFNFDTLFHFFARYCDFVVSCRQDSSLTVQNMNFYLIMVRE